MSSYYLHPTFWRICATCTHHRHTQEPYHHRKLTSVWSRCLKTLLRCLKMKHLRFIIIHSLIAECHLVLGRRCRHTTFTQLSGAYVPHTHIIVTPKNHTTIKTCAKEEISPHLHLVATLRLYPGAEATFG
jgi:hypothetical protein